MAQTFTPFDPNKIKADVFISGGTASRIKKFQNGNIVDVYSDTVTGADQNKLLDDFEGFSADYRKALAQKLKAAGYYKGDITGKPTLKLQEAYFDAYTDLNDYNRSKISRYITDSAQTYNVELDNLDTFLAKQDTSGEGGGGGGDITKIQYEKKFSTDSIEASIDKVFRDLTGSGATKAQIAKYTKNIQTQLAKPENLGQTEYKNMGGGLQRQVITEAAFNPESYLIEEVSKGDPAKASSVMGFYEVFDKFIGRG
jgi:hypothetical protein